MPDSRIEEANWFRKIRHSNWGLALIAIAIVITNLGNVFEGLEKIAHFFSKKPEAALQIYRYDELSRFSRDLARLSSSRQVAMNRYLTYIQRKYSIEEQTKAWEKYAAVFDDWNRELTVNLTGIRQFYPEKLQQFEDTIQCPFSAIHSCLESVRRSHNPVDSCKNSETEELLKSKCDLAEVSMTLGNLQSNIYVFVTGLAKSKASTSTSD
jgi:hypothetical protein